MEPGPASRVVVTGIGVVSPWGWSAEEFRAGITGGTTSIGPFDRFDHRGYGVHIAGQVPPEPGGRPGRSQAGSGISLADRFAVAAAVESVECAGLPRDLSRLRAGVFFGSSTGGLFESESFYARHRRAPIGRALRASLAAQPVSRPGEAVARRLRATGPVETVSSSCASGTLAIGQALHALRAGEVGLALAGGADSLCRVTYGGFNALQLMSPRPCHPFRGELEGLSLGEGGAVLVLETEEHATRRGAVALAELLGAGAAGDAYHMTAPEPDGTGAARAVRCALRDAGRRPEEIDLINAHGTGTPLNDVAEHRALERVFGDRTSTIPLVANKASVGHLLGSAGAIEAVAVVLALRDQCLQPTPGAGEVDPRTPVRLTARLEPLSVRLALSVSLGFGGCNGALVFGRPSDA